MTISLVYNVRKVKTDIYLFGKPVEKLGRKARSLRFFLKTTIVRLQKLTISVTFFIVSFIP